METLPSLLHHAQCKCRNPSREAVKFLLAVPRHRPNETKKHNKFEAKPGLYKYYVFARFPVNGQLFVEEEDIHCGLSEKRPGC